MKHLHHGCPIYHAQQPYIVWKQILWLRKPDLEEGKCLCHVQTVKERQKDIRSQVICLQIHRSFILWQDFNLLENLILKSKISSDTVQKAACLLGDTVVMSLDIQGEGEGARLYPFIARMMSDDGCFRLSGSEDHPRLAQ